MEIYECGSKENYSKVVLHKKLCVTLLASPEDRSHQGSPDLEGWRLRQEAERERIRQLDHTPKPPERPPKKLHLLRKVEPEDNSSKVSNTIDVLTPRPFVLSSLDQSRNRPQKTKPVVPPKPKFYTGNKKCLNNRNNSQDTNKQCDQVTKEDKLGNTALDVRAGVDQPIHEGVETLEGATQEKRGLQQHREQLLGRIKHKVDILREDGTEVLVETQAVKAQGGSLVVTLEEQGSWVEADKLRVHLQEVERITSLLKVLTGRLDRTDKLLVRTQDMEHKDLLFKKKKRLQTQIAEAEELKKFRNRRGRQIESILENLLSKEEVDQYKNHLKNLEKVVAEQKEVEEKIQLGQEQIEALSRKES